MRPQAAGGPTDLTGARRPSPHLSGEGTAGGFSLTPAPLPRRDSRDRGRERSQRELERRSRPASRGSAKPAPMRDAQRDRASPTAKKRGDWSAGLRPASRGSAKPAPMTPRYANVSAAPSPSIGCRDRSPLLLSRLRPATVPIGVVCYNYDLYIQTETRYISVGEVDGVAIIVVAHTKRSGRIRLISARPASRKEKQARYEHLR